MHAAGRLTCREVLGHAKEIVFRRRHSSLWLIVFGRDERQELPSSTLSVNRSLGGGRHGWSTEKEENEHHLRRVILQRGQRGVYLSHAALFFGRVVGVQRTALVSIYFALFALVVWAYGK